jgi:hypothetical protein
MSNCSGSGNSKGGGAAKSAESDNTQNNSTPVYPCNEVNGKFNL